MTRAFLAGLVAGYGVAIPVGAIAILILGLSARTSFRVGAAAALAVATADGLYAVVAVLGGAGLAGIIAPVAGPLRVVAAVVLLGLAGHGLWRTWSAHRSRVTPTARAGRGMGTPGRAYAALLGLTLLNPMTVLYFTALVLGRRDTADSGVLAVALFVAGVFVASASWQLVIAGGGTVVGRALTGPRGRLVTGLLSSALIAALAVAALLPS
ncbi:MULTISPECIES: LysE family transporter [Micromonospora]|uniref:LysE family transporter n=1 Tax=Micromonospora TaxID=1873 RepID=UPI001EE81B44|nr:LysE family transporter [Micromonospora hortensis]MCG5447895.1 LysE family transporter [Micromonospora hortensis]WTI06500.1 LysE family transporter [Micromonospora sp. NBC_00821]